MGGRKQSNKTKMLFDYNGELLSAKEVMERSGRSRDFYRNAIPAKVQVIEIYHNGELFDVGTSLRGLSIRNHYGLSYFAQAEFRKSGEWKVERKWMDADEWERRKNEKEAGHADCDRR